MYEPSIYSDVGSNGVSITYPQNESYSRNKISSSLEEGNVGNKVQWDKSTNPIRDSVQESERKRTFRKKYSSYKEQLKSGLENKKMRAMPTVFRKVDDSNP